MENRLINESEIDLFLRQVLNIGEAMYTAGSEISRIENTLYRLGKAYGAEHVNVYAITSSIVVTIEFPGMAALTQSRRIRRESTDLSKLEKLNALCRQCSRDPLPVVKLRERVLEILSEKPSDLLVLAGYFLAAGFFVLFFGGSFFDAVVGALCACLIWLMQRFLKPLCSGQVFINLIISFISGVLVCALSSVVPVLNQDKIIIGDIMVLIPGIAITNSIRYTISGDSISGVEKLIGSVLQALGIAAGFTLAIYLFRG